MIDIEIYKALHPESFLALANYRSDIDPETMAKEEFPTDNVAALVVPSRIPGYNLRMKRWSKSIR